MKAEIPNQWITTVNYIDQATVPLIKITCSLEALMRSAGLPFPKNPKYEEIYHQSFSIDITHMTDFHNGIECVNLVKDYL